MSVPPQDAPSRLTIFRDELTEAAAVSDFDEDSDWWWCTLRRLMMTPSPSVVVFVSFFLCGTEIFPLFKIVLEREHLLLFGSPPLSLFSFIYSSSEMFAQRERSGD